MDHLIPVFFHPGTQGNHHVLIVDGTSQTIDTGHRGHDDNILSLRQRRCCRMAQLIDLVVDGGILLDICVRGRDVSLRLVVVIVADKVFHRIIGKKFLHFRIKLGCQRLIMCNN